MPGKLYIKTKTILLHLVCLNKWQILKLVLDDNPKRLKSKFKHLYKIKYYCEHLFIGVFIIVIIFCRITGDLYGNKKSFTSEL